MFYIRRKSSNECATKEFFTKRQKSRKIKSHRKRGSANARIVSGVNEWEIRILAKADRMQLSVLLWKRKKRIRTTQPLISEKSNIYYNIYELPMQMAKGRQRERTTNCIACADFFFVLLFSLTNVSYFFYTKALFFCNLNDEDADTGDDARWTFKLIASCCYVPHESFYFLLRYFSHSRSSFFWYQLFVYFQFFSSYENRLNFLASFCVPKIQPFHRIVFYKLANSRDARL